MPPAKLRWALGLTIVVAALLATWPALGNNFINWDDRDQITQNPDFNPVRLSRMIEYWRGPYVGSLYPVSYNFFGLLAVLGRSTDGAIDPFAFHLASVTLHVAGALLVFAILRLLVERDVPACAGALLFAVHPVQVEAVAWVSGMNTLLFAVLSLAAIWLYLLSRRPDATMSRRAMLLTTATIAFLLALWAKPAAVVVPVVAWLLDRLMTSRPWRDLPVALIAWLLLAIPIVWITRSLQTGELITPTPIWTRPFVAGDAISFYFYKLIFPARLLVDYGRTPQFVAANRWTWTLLLVPVLLAIACWRLRLRYPWLAIALAVFVVTLLPVLGLTPFDVQMISTVTDRYLYLAMLAPAIVLAYALSRVQSRTAYVAVGIVLILLTARSTLRARQWHDEFTLFLPELEFNPHSLAAHQVLGVTFASKNKPELAAEHLTAALVVKPDDPRSLYNLANLLLRHNQPADAIPLYRRALVKFPSNARIHSNLALALMLTGDLDESDREFRRALELSPGMPEATQGLQQLAARRMPSTKESVE